MGFELPGMGGGGGGGGGGSNQPAPQSYVDNSFAYSTYANAMRDRMPVYDSWINRGNWAGDTQQNQTDWLLNNPNALQDQIAAGYQESPWSKYSMDQMTKRMNYNAANTGMLGSGAANRALQQELVGMNGQFMGDYVNRGMDTYKLGYSGLDGLQKLGFDALGQQTNLYDRAAAAELQGQKSKNIHDAMNPEDDGGGWLGTGLGIVGGVIGAYFGGPMGASAGYGIGSQVGNQIDGNGQQKQQQQGGGGMGGGMQMPNFGGMFGGGGGGQSFQPGVNSMNGMQAGSGGFSPSNYNSGGWSY
jgi:hypothetical protein